MIKGSYIRINLQLKNLCIFILLFISQNNEMIQKHIWRPVNYCNGSNAKPAHRWGHSCCVVGQELVLFGGYADSIYMNDVWVYHTALMQWTQIKTTGSLPSQRSNSSLHYDSYNNRIIMFGGGGSNKTRFNSIHFLDWNSKVWTQLSYKQNQTCPWERTYHSSQLLYPYLVVYGGQGVADLDDLWVFNLKTLKWSEIPISKNSLKPCGRRFHSSCLIGNQFYVIAGCYSKYRPLSDVFSIDLTSLVRQNSFEGLSWKEVKLKGSSFLARWGHACASLDKKIYIFGGRFSNDLNDVLVIDTQTMRIKSLKTPAQTLPKARRRACINFIGNCLLMFGGFNTQYFNDLHYINVSDDFTKPKKYTKNQSHLLKIIDSQQFCDLQIQTILGQKVKCNRSMLMRNFETQQKLDQLLTKINKKENKQAIIQLITALYMGYGKSEIVYKYCQSLPKDQIQKQSNFIKFLDKLKDQKSTQTQNIFSSKKSKTFLRVLNNNIIELNDQKFGQFLQRNRQSIDQDVQLVINNEYVLKSNIAALATSSKYFYNIFTSKYRECKERNSQVRLVRLWLPYGSVVEMEIIINFLLTDMLVIPENMSCQTWMELYLLTDYFSLLQLRQISLYSIWSKIDQSTVDKIFQFSMKQKLQQLSISCARYKMKNIDYQLTHFANKYIQQVYKQNRFQIKQKMVNKCNPFMKKKVSSISTQGQKQNYQTYNQ